ncbi:hypothetical protein IAT38_000204 [Cryptococcus sp. DSM 104549]
MVASTPLRKSLDMAAPTQHNNSFEMASPAQVDDPHTTSSDIAFSRSATMVSADDNLPSLSPPIGSSATLTDVHGAPKVKAFNKGQEHPSPLSTTGQMEAGTAVGAEGSSQHKKNVLAELPPRKKGMLLLCFCLAMFIDAAGISATFMMTAPIAADLDITPGNQAWILNTYSLAFAATLLCAGRLADLYPPHLVYTIGFIGIAVFYLIISFMQDQYSFLVLRAISALLAVLTIPSSINMIVQMYPDPAVQGQKLALFSMSGALANTTALILAGVFLLASWRWYFRFITILVTPFSILAWFLLPKTEAVVQDLPGAAKLKRMDIGGVLILVASLVLFILGFTQATVDGWSSAIFIAPFVISIALFAAFIVWEHSMPRGYALLPHDIWRFPNIFPLILQASSAFMWFAIAQLRMATYFQDALHNSTIISAVKILPMGITSLVAGAAIQTFPWLITRPHLVQPISSVMCLVGSLLFAFSGGGNGNDYWRYTFPGQIIGAAGGMTVFIGMNTSIIQAFPIEFAGIGGSFSNIIFQVGSVVGTSIQAGLLATGDGTVQDWTGSKNSYFFSGGYVMATGIIFFLGYKQSKVPQREGSAAVV